MNYQRFLREIKNIEDIEYYNAKQNNKLAYHLVKWEYQKKKPDVTKEFITQYIDRMSI